MLTKNRSEVALELIKILSESDLGLEEVFYGDEEIIKKLPAASVVPGTLNKELAGANYVTLNHFTMEIILYHGREGAVGLTRQGADEFAELVEDELHKHPQLNGLVVHGFVTTTEPGYMPVRGVSYVATRLIWTGKSKTILNPGG